MHALDPVDDLGHAQVDDDARERERVAALEPELALHQVEHRRHRLLRGEVEVLGEAERDPGGLRASDRRTELELGKLERQLRALDRALDRRAGNLAVALRRVAVPAEKSAPSTLIGR